MAALRHWRARPGEIFTVVDPEGQEYRARLTSLNDTSACLRPFTWVKPSESPLAIKLYQAIPEKERFELVLQKTTEIGVAAIVPFTCLRSVSLAERDAGQKKSHRWPDVLLRAARQCRRAMLPELYPVLGWQQLLQDQQSSALSLLCYEGDYSLPLCRALDAFGGRKVNLIVGPEGGFTPEEVAEARQAGVTTVHMGPRVLRTETAGILAVAMAQLILGDLRA